MAVKYGEIASEKKSKKYISFYVNLCWTLKSLHLVMESMQS